MKKGIIAGLAVVGTVATIGLLNADSSSQDSSFLQVSGPEAAFQHYIAKFGKSYPTKEEYEFRFKQFLNTYKLVAQHNAENGDHGFTLGFNSLSDLTDAEFQSMLGFRDGQEWEDKKPKSLSTEGLPDKIDWLAAGKVNGPKNQGACGSCWAFSAIGAIEGVQAIVNNQLLNLSEQQLVDCSHDGPADDKNQGCGGGWMDSAFAYATRTKLEEQTDYPYEAKNQDCADKDAATKGKVLLSGWENVPVNDPDQLKAAVAQQPVSVALQAGSPYFRSYNGGVLSSTACGHNLDHGVLVVGYGTTESGVPFWRLKNSWGTAWGEQGTFRILRTDKKDVGICGLLQKASYPLVNKSA